MNDFLYTLANKETEAANLFIKNSRTLARGDQIELARELTDLRVQLTDAQESIKEIQNETGANAELEKETTLLEYFLIGLFMTTLILLGISYILY